MPLAKQRARLTIASVVAHRRALLVVLAGALDVLVHAEALFGQHADPVDCLGIAEIGGAPVEAVGLAEIRSRTQSAFLLDRQPDNGRREIHFGGDLVVEARPRDVLFNAGAIFVHRSQRVGGLGIAELKRFLVSGEGGGIFARCEQRPAKLKVQSIGLGRLLDCIGAGAYGVCRLDVLEPDSGG